MEQQLGAWFDTLLQHGPMLVYAVLFLACFIENFFPPFPGDTVILLAASMVHLGRLDLVQTLLVVLSGGLLSAGLVYFCGQKWGKSILQSNRIPFLKPGDFEKTETLFHKWGGWMVVISRFLFGVRSIMCFLAGSVRYPFGKYMSLSALSYLVFVSLIYFAASVATESADALYQLTGSIERTITIIVVSFVVIWILFRIVWKQRVNR